MKTYKVTKYYPTNITRETIEKEIQHFIAKEQKREEPEEYKIKWIDATMENYEEAASFIKEIKTEARVVAIRFKYVKKPDTDEFRSAVNRLNQTKEIYERIENEIHYQQKNIKAEFITCRSCGSHIARKFIKTNFCPVCGEDMRPPTNIDIVNSRKRSVERAQERVNKLLKKAADNPETYWLIQIEYEK